MVYHFMQKLNPHSNNPLHGMYVCMYVCICIYIYIYNTVESILALWKLFFSLDP